MANLIILFFVLLTTNYFVFETNGVPCGILPFAKFDYIKLAIQWGPGVCNFNRQCREYDEKWSIHGLWPQNVTRGEYVEFCCDEQFDENIADYFKTDLKKHWYSSTMNDFNFWSHEWRKHGTCALGSPRLRKQKTYFLKTLELFKSVDSILSNMKAIPRPLSSRSSEQNLDNLRLILKSKLGKKVQFGCRIEKHISPVPFLSEVYVCYDSELNIIDCPNYDRCRGKWALFLSKQRYNSNAI